MSDRAGGVTWTNNHSPLNGPVFDLILRDVSPDPLRGWMMDPVDKFAVYTLLERLRPACAIEVGTASGGSLQVIAHFARQVYTLDIDPACRGRLAGRFPNVEFVTGDSAVTFPALLDRLGREGAKVGFILIDGDHAEAGVRTDVRSLLAYRPRCPLYVLFHDTFNPRVRGAIARADWASSPYVHAVELDLTTGSVISKREMWGGLGLALMLPEERRGPPALNERQRPVFRCTKAKMYWSPAAFTARLARRVRNVFRKP
jgi:hypothetical protein